VRKKKCEVVFEPVTSIAKVNLTTTRPEGEINTVMYSLDFVFEAEYKALQH
jgi:hypothetical protein